MKKFFLVCASLVGIFSVSSAYSNYGVIDGDSNCGCPATQPTGNCYCQYVEYQPCPYTTTHCYKEEVPCERTCCRYVPQYYQVQCCRYVPEYYKVPYCTYRTRSYCVQHCKYIPRTYWKQECKQACNPCNTCN